jgi:large subunit ribosomal protein L40
MRLDCSCADAYSDDPIPPPASDNAQTASIFSVRFSLALSISPHTNTFHSNRALRHWTIHRAWNLYQSKLRRDHTVSLEKQYNSMAAACEALRLIDNHGLTAEERLRLGAGESEGSQMGKLFRIAMQKKGIWDGVPIEYARIQTDTPPREGWNHGWTR